MEKKISSRTIAQVKSIFKFNEKNYADLAKVNAKLEELEAEKTRLETSISLAEQPIINMFGYKSGELIEVVITPLFNEDGTPKMDSEGKYQQKKKQYVCKYGEAFLPSEENVMPADTVETSATPENSNDFNAASTSVEEPTI